MIGIDIIKIARVYKLEDDFPNRVLSREELERYQSFGEDEDEKARFLASRWAAKEAYVKASGERSVDFRTISVMADESGRPHLRVRGVEVGEVSLAHDSYAIAIVQLDKENYR